MEKKKLYGRMITLLLFLICCGLSPTLSAIDYTWNGTDWDASGTMDGSTKLIINGSGVKLEGATKTLTPPAGATTLTKVTVNVGGTNVGANLTFLGPNVSITDLEIAGTGTGVGSVTIGTIPVTTVTMTGTSAHTLTGTGISVTNGGAINVSRTVTVAVNMADPTKVGAITLSGTGPHTLNLNAAIKEVGNISLTGGGAGHTISSLSTLDKIGNITLAGANAIDFSGATGLAGKTIANVTLSETAKITFDELINITTLTVNRTNATVTATAEFTKGANVTNFRPTDLKNRGVILGQNAAAGGITIATSGNISDHTTLGLTAPITSVDVINIDPDVEVIVDKKDFSIYGVGKMDVGSILDELDLPLKINGPAPVNTDIKGSWIGILSYKTQSPNGPGWYYSGEFLGTTGNVLTTDKVRTSIAVTMVCPQTALAGSPAFATPPVVYFTQGGVLNVPSTISEIGKVIAKKRGSAVLIANGTLTTGAIEANNEAIFTLKNTQGINQAKVTIKSGSPAIYIDNGAIVNIDTTSTIIEKDVNGISISIINDGVLNYRLGHYLNNCVIDGDVVVGGLIGIVNPGTFNFIGTGRALSSPSSPASLRIGGNVEMGTYYDFGTPAYDVSGDTTGRFVATNTTMYIDAELNTQPTTLSGASTLLSAGPRLDLRGTEAHFGGIAMFDGISPENIATDENTSLIFDGAAIQTSFPATPTNGRNLFSVRYNSTVAHTAPISGTINMYGDFMLYTENPRPATSSAALKIGNDGTNEVTTTITVNGKFDMVGSTALAYGGTAATTPLQFILNGEIADWGGTAYNNFMDVTIGGNANPVVPFPVDIVSLRNLTVNRPNAMVMSLSAGNFTLSGNLNVTSGTFKTYNGTADVPLVVEDNTIIGRGGLLDLNIGAATVTHTLGVAAAGNLIDTVINNGQIRFQGTPTAICELVMNGQYLNSQGAMTGDITSDLILNAEINMVLPTSLTELNILEYNINSTPLAISPILSLGNNLTVKELVNTSGILSIAGYTLKVLDGTSTVAPTGYVDVKNSSTFDISVAGDLTLSFLLPTDSSSSLVLRDAVYTPAIGLIEKIKDLTLMGETNDASYTVNPTQTSLEIFGNVNIIGNATYKAEVAVTDPINEVTIHGNVAIVAEISSVALDISNAKITMYGLMSANDYLNGQILVNDITELNIRGTSSQFQLPIYQIPVPFAKLLIDRPSGVKLNPIISSDAANILILGNPAAGLALDIRNGMLDLNGCNIKFAHLDNYMSETPTGFVTNTGTSFFYEDLGTASFGGDSTKGAIISIASASIEQIRSIGINNENANGIATGEGAVRRYPKSVTVPNVGRSVRRYYYVDVDNTNTLKNLNFTYFKNEAVGNEATMKVYLEDLAAVTGPTTDAFSNSEQLKGNVLVNVATNAGPGVLMVSKFESGISYGVTNEGLNGSQYLITFASLPGGGGAKIWTNGTGDRQWQTAGNWGPTPGAPGVLDQAIVARYTGDIFISGLATCGDLFVDGDDIRLFGAPTTQTNHSVLQVTGNITVEGASVIKGIDGSGTLAKRLDLKVGDGIIQGVGTNILARYTDADATVGVWFDNVEINLATLKPSDGMRVSGNITLNGNSTILQEEGQQIVLYGPNSTAKTLKLSSNSAAIFGDIVLMNTANMTTEADFQLKGAFIFMDATSRWISTAGIIRATTKDQLLWDNKGNADFQVFSMTIGTTNDPTSSTNPDPVQGVSEPVGSITFRGTLSKIGNSKLKPVYTAYTDGSAGQYAVIFNSKTQTEIVNSAVGELLFQNLIVRPSTKLKTSSSFNIQNYLYVGDNAEMICESGKVTYDGLNVMQIVNISTQTLVHNDVLIKGRVTTPTSWTLAGNMVVDSIPAYNYFEQTAGTITINNGGQVKRLMDFASSNGATPYLPLDFPSITFNKLYISDNSILRTGAVANASNPTAAPDTTNASFAIKNREANNGMASGIEVAPTGQFLQPAEGTVHFQTDGTIADTTSKWIVNSNSANKMQFGNIYVEAGYANNNVKTKSSFEVIGYIDETLPTPISSGSQDAQFLVAGGGANFDATEGTIHFTAIENTARISAIAPSNAQFASLRSSNNITLRLTEGSEIGVSGNLIADNTSNFVAGNLTTPIATSILNINGKDAPQYLVGNTTVSPAFTFTKFRINKGDNLPVDYVDNPYSNPSGILYMQKSTAIVGDNSADVSEFIMTNGVLNLGVDTLTVAAMYITRHNGAVDGAKGTYIITTGHQTPYLENPFFMVSNNPTLNNLIVEADHQLRNDLTINGNLTLTAGKLTLAPVGLADIVDPKLLTLYGDLVKDAGLLASGSDDDNTLTRLVLKGKGKVIDGLRNDLFDGSDGAFSISIQRGETLGNTFTMDTVNGANLTIQTGVNTLALNGNTLILSDYPAKSGNPVGITIISGSITADETSVVDFRSIDIIPANIFARSEAGTIILGGGGSAHASDIQIRGDVKINTALRIGTTTTGHPAVPDIMRIYTGDNILTIGPNAAVVDLNSNHYVVGNLQRTVSNVNKTRFDVGTNNHTPVYMQYASPGTTQEILVTSNQVDPAADRGGNPDNTINVLWNIQPQGDPVRDSLLLEFGFAAAEQTANSIGTPITLTSNNTFAAKWDNGRWYDYRNTIRTVNNTPDPYNVVGPLSRYPVRNSEALEGDWAIFVAEQNTDVSKDNAIRIDNDRIAIKEIAAPAMTGIPFNVVIALEDKYQQPRRPSEDLDVLIKFGNGGLTFAEGDSIVVTFPAGVSERNVRLQVSNTNVPSTSPIAQLLVRATGDSASRWTPAISDYFAVIPEAPATQAFNVQFPATRITYTTAKVTWENGDGENVLIVAKERNLLEPNEKPLNAVTYTPNQVYGAGSNIGNAVVLYKGPRLSDTQSIEIAGLLPNTSYYVYAFAYNGNTGEESYNISAAMRNPGMLSTLKGNNDDITLGPNNDYEGSTTVGTNSTIVGMIYPAGDVDCFNFMVTSAAPNVRVLLNNLPDNYTLELYDFTNRRIRRSTLNGKVNEALVVNNLPAGTYVVKVFAEDNNSAADINRPEDVYRLLINTFSNEIFSVTPVSIME